MSLRYEKIVKSPAIFHRLFGISVKDFSEVIEALKPLWEKKVTQNYKRPGRNFKMTLEDRVLMLLLYYRTYISQRFVAFLFDIDDSRVCRILQRLEPLLAQVMALPKDRSLSSKDVEEILMDATEQPIERPSKGQKSYYSGKKKRHCLKTEIRVSLKGKIVHVSKTYPGSLHDFSLHKQEPPLSPHTRVYVDSGYQGLDKRHVQTELPFKASKSCALTKQDKLYNRALSRVRIVVEHVIGDLKTFKILADRYRNKGKRYNIKFKIIAGLVNRRNGFMPA